MSCDWLWAGILSCDWLLQAADPVLLLQPDRALPADRLHGGARLHAAARLGGETQSRSGGIVTVELQTIYQFSQSRRRPLLGHCEN